MPTRTTRVLGHSTDGRPIRLTERGGQRPGRTILVFGAIHGTEPAGIAITRLLLTGPPPRSGAVWVIQDLNPDGRAAGTRGNARGVDLNRNFPSQWRPIGRRGDPEYAGPRPLSEAESRLGVRAIESVRPDVTVWFHQPQTIVRAFGQSEPTARRYARLVGRVYRRIPWPSGAAPNWQNHRVPGRAAFVVELAPGPPTRASALRHARVIRRLAAAANDRGRSRARAAGRCRAAAQRDARHALRAPTPCALSLTPGRPPTASRGRSARAAIGRANPRGARRRTRSIRADGGSPTSGRCPGSAAIDGARAR
jgi:protein MpaA